ncbi:hypothetical protein E3J74_08840 [Candidatus Bathyarchaeota archaeon]|nr:MAG: hypothetical protein E3J74_08840 [Candidatus Bathyarchaeota archaeon]
MTLKLSQKQLLLLAAILAISLILATSNLLIPLIAHTPTTHDTTMPDLLFEPEALGLQNVAILDFSFTPPRICIEKGDMVTWTNNDQVIYTLWLVFAGNTSTYLVPAPIPPGQSWSHTFTEPCKLIYYSFERLWVTGKASILSIMGDITGPENPPASGEYPPDGRVDGWDMTALSKAYGSTSGSSNWNEDADMTGPENPPASGQYPPDGVVDGWDMTLASKNYGKIDP